jgi:hypothetical protein
MTTTQWLFEYHSLQEKEKQDTENLIETLKVSKKMLVNLLGLNLLKEPGDTEDDETFTPLSMLTGRREIVETILNNMDKDKQIQQALDDQHFDELSTAFANDDIGDMEPVVFNEEEIKQKLEIAKQEEREQELRAAGVKIVDSAPSNIPHIKFDMSEDAKQIRDSIKIAEKQIEDIKKPSIKFDDNG